MFEFARDILAIIGFGVAFSVIAILISIAIDKIKDAIKEKKYKYKREHRFDGPPIAECYCKDCIFWRKDGEHNGKCSMLNNFYTADNGFCWSSRPRLNDPEGR